MFANTDKENGEHTILSPECGTFQVTELVYNQN